MSIIIGTYTMNAGSDIPGSAIKYMLETYHDKLPYMVVVDGNLTSEAKAYYKKFPKLRYMNSPWRDSHLAQYKARDSLVDEGDWVLALDDDELPSDELFEFISNQEIEKTLNNNNLNMCYVPGVLYIHDGENGYKFLQAEDVDLDNGFFKAILYKKTNSLNYIHSNEYHTVPTHGTETRAVKIPYHYIHLKTAESFIINDCHNAFISPENERYTAVQAKQLREIKKEYKFNTLEDFKKAVNDLPSGKYPLLEDFAMTWRHADTNAYTMYLWFFMIAHPNWQSVYRRDDVDWKASYERLLNPNRISRIESAIVNHDYVTIETTPFLVSPYRHEVNN